jgi:hypothetical protein
LIKHSEKWKLREHEASPKKGAIIQLDDDSYVERGKNKPGGNKREDEKIRKLA